ncbi:hypothetical protein [Amycolatopsis sp. NPDC051372]|uniref:hypothetical protein n=1 Tax=Amycolatopsis sp. NPDC051372 TaxID=3155669 RepID=UPI003430B28B
MLLSVARLKKMFAEANGRRRMAGLRTVVHARMLRHSFAVITLAQLQRSHLTATGTLDEAGPGQYVQVIGDPLGWVRPHLGHRSVTNTQIYVHTLAELDMQTRLALAPETWTDGEPEWGALGDAWCAVEEGPVRTGPHSCRAASTHSLVSSTTWKAICV